MKLQAKAILQNIKTMNKKKKLCLGIGALVVLAAGIGFFMKGNNGAAGGMGGAPGMGGAGGMGGMRMEAATIVRAAVPEKGDISVFSSLNGTVEAAEMICIYAKAGGDVHAVNIKAGDMVEAGDILFEIDTAQVDSAKNQMESAEVSMNEAKNNLTRMTILYQGGDLSDQEYEGYQNKARTTQLQYESAKLNYERQVEYSSVTAPISGRIESCDIEVYDRIQNNTQMCVIAGEGNKTLTFYVTQRMLNHLNVGDELQIIRNSKEYKGWITEISNMVDSSTGLFKIKGALENTDEIAIGSSVKLILETDRAQNAMMVPVNAVYYSGGDGFVYLYQDGIAKMTPVEVGLYDDEHAQILSGITENDMVVGTWSSNLYEGAKLRLPGESGNTEGSGRKPEGKEFAGKEEKTDQGDRPTGDKESRSAENNSGEEKKNSGRQKQQ